MKGTAWKAALQLVVLLIFIQNTHMSRKRKNRNRRRTAKPKPKPNKSQNIRENVASLKKSKTRRLVSVVLWLLGILGTMLGIWTVLTPKVSVEPSVALDPNNPAFTPFVVHNQGQFSIYQVEFSCSMAEIHFPGGIRAIAEKEYENSFSDPRQIASIIGPGEKYTQLLPLTKLGYDNFEQADIAINLSYRPIKWFPKQRSSQHRFVSTKDTNGIWHWLPQPIDE